MGAHVGPDIEVDGVVLYYDTLNSDNSYLGPDVSNLIYKKTTTNYTGEFLNSATSTETAFIPELGTLDVLTNNFINNHPNTGTTCCPTIFRFSEAGTQKIPLTASTLYTYAIVYRVESGYTHPNFMYRYEYDVSGVKTTEGGVHSNSRRVHLGDNWYWAWGTFTTQPTTVEIRFSGFFYYRYSTTRDKVQLAKVFMSPGDWTELHPKYWPEVNTTRSASESLLDIFNNNTITINNLSYEKNGAFSFDGTDDYLTVSNFNSDTISEDFTFSAWVYMDEIPTSNPRILHFATDSNNVWNMAMYGGSSPENYSWFWIERKKAGSFYGSAGTSFKYTANTWYNVCGTFNNTTNTPKLYINGALIPSGGGVGGGAPATIGDLYIGSTTFTGKIDQVKIYSRELSEAEVAQNYRATKGRYT